MNFKGEQKPIFMYLGVLTHTTAWEQHWEGDKEMK